jgi:hypothetical protein
MSYSPRMTRRGGDPLCGPVTEATRRRLRWRGIPPVQRRGSRASSTPVAALHHPAARWQEGSTTPGHSLPKIAGICGECQTRSTEIRRPRAQNDTLLSMHSGGAGCPHPNACPHPNRHHATPRPEATWHPALGTRPVEPGGGFVGAGCRDPTLRSGLPGLSRFHEGMAGRGGRARRARRRRSRRAARR